MFEVQKAMLTINGRGLLFAGKHVLAPLGSATRRFNLEYDLEPVLAQLTAGYMRPVNTRTVSLLYSALAAWNRGDFGRAAYDLILTSLPDPKDNTNFYERIEAVDKAIATGRRPKDVLKTFGVNPAWMDEARVPAGQTDAGEWVSGDNDTGDVTNIAAHSGDPSIRWNAKVKALPQSSLDALRTAMRLEDLPANQFDDMAWIMAQESQGVVGVPNNRGGSASGLFQLQPSNYHFYPNGAKSIGNAVEEAQGGIRYMLWKYGNAARAKAAWVKNYNVNPNNPFW